MLRLLRLAILGGVVASATVLMALPREGTAARRLAGAPDVARSTGTLQEVGAMADGLLDKGRSVVAGAVDAARRPGTPAGAEPNAAAPAPAPPSGPVTTTPILPAPPAPVASPGRAPEALAAAGSRTHVVARGETLSKIAKTYYGNANAWQRILDANPSCDPKKIKAGQMLVIPAAPGGARR